MNVNIHKYQSLQSLLDQTIDIFAPIYYHPTSEAVHDSAVPVGRIQYFFVFTKRNLDILKYVEFLPNIFTKDLLNFKYF